VTASSAMTISTLVTISFVAGVFFVAVWAARRPTERSTLIGQLTRAPNQDASQGKSSISVEEV